MWGSSINVDDIEGDPQGASVAVWQKGLHCWANRVREPVACCWNDLASKDIAANGRAAQIDTAP